MRSETPYNLRLPARDRRTIFREMAKGEFRRGPMSPRRQRQLVAYAARLGIHPTESTELIHEAAKDLGINLLAAQPIEAAPAHDIGPINARLWLTAALLAVAATVFHLVLRQSW